MAARDRFGWGAAAGSLLVVCLGIALVKKVIADREREKKAIELCRGRCKLSGQCQFDAKTQACRARGSQDCRQADVCKTNGLCSYSDGACQATTEEECRGSEQCKEAGRCHLSGNPLVPCVPGSNEDCAAAAVCQRLGRCTVSAGSCDVTGNADCARSLACTKYGQCSVKTVDTADGQVLRCAALSNDDCKKGEDCTARGLCTAVDDSCR
jgi:hypothetical protein